MKFLPVLVLLVSAFAFSGCNEEKYAKNQSSKTAWLSSVSGKATTDVSGMWQSSDWGTGQLSQSGNKITGNLGSYTVEGKLNGRSVYLALNSGGWTYYTARLRKNGDNLSGSYSSSVPFSSADQWPMLLRRN